MKTETKRLLRLAQGQAQLTRLLEAQVLATRQELARLHEVRAGTMAALDRAGPTGLVVYAAAMRRLIELDIATARMAGELGDMEKKLFLATGRQDILMRHARKLAASEERAALESEARDNLFAGKGRGKPRVLE